MSSTSAVAVLAQGLRELRDFAEGPDGEELRERTGLTTQQIDTALAGERLPTREATLALVEAWEGDVEAWREYWSQISELAEEDAAEDAGGRTKKAKTPAPPEPSIITPIPDVEPGADEAEKEPARAEAEAEVSAEAEAAAEQAVDAEDSAAAEKEAARTRARLEANAQATKAQSEAMAAAAAEAEAEQADAAGAVAKQAAEKAEGEQADAAGPARAKQAAEQAARAESASEAGAQAAAGSGESKLAGEKTVPAQRSAESAEAAAAAASEPKSAAAAAESAAAEPPKTQTAPVLEGVVVAGGASQPAKKSVLARVGIPILLFAIGVGVGAFGDHALNSKQSSTDTAASVPPVSSSSKPSHTSASSASSGGGTSASGITPTSPPSSVGDNPSGSESPTETSTSGSASSTVAAGSVIGSYVNIQLASGYSVNFLTDPYHPATGTADGPDTMGFFATSFVDGRFYADRVAILDPTDTGSYASCLNDTRYQHDVLLSQVAANSNFCITTGTGHVVLVTVRRMPSSTDANPYAVVDVTIWQGS